jgi:hypothetical protein
VSPAVTAARSLRRPAAKLRSSRTGLFSALAQAGRFSPYRWQSMTANSRTRAQVASISSQRAVIYLRAVWSSLVSWPGGVRIQRVTGAFIDGCNEHPRLFTWTKDADEILAKIERVKAKTSAHTHH